MLHLACALSYSLIGVFSRLSLVENELPYTSSSVVFLAEVIKLFVSLVRSRKLHLQDHGSWPLVFVVSAIYTVNNNLEFYLPHYLDLTTEKTLLQARILTTVFVWSLVFQRRPNWNILVGLFLIFIGCTWISASQSGTRFAHPFGLFLIMIHVVGSAFAGVLTEFTYKRGSFDSINCQMYAFGVLLNLPSSFEGFNVYAYLAALNYACLGFLCAQEMSRYSNLTKIISQAGSVLISYLFSIFLFKDDFDLFYLQKLFIVMAGLVLCGLERV